MNNIGVLFYRYIQRNTKNKFTIDLIGKIYIYIILIYMHCDNKDKIQSGEKLCL